MTDPYGRGRGFGVAGLIRFYQRQKEPENGKTGGISAFSFSFLEVNLFLARWDGWMTEMKAE